MHNVIGVDIGGTFTDFVYYDPKTGQIHNWKYPTTPKEPIEAVLEGLKQVANLAHIDKIRLGTTIATNARRRRLAGACVRAFLSAPVRGSRACGFQTTQGGLISGET